MRPLLINIKHDKRIEIKDILVGKNQLFNFPPPTFGFSFCNEDPNRLISQYLNRKEYIA